MDIRVYLFLCPQAFTEYLKKNMNGTSSIDVPLYFLEFVGDISEELLIKIQEVI